MSYRVYMKVLRLNLLLKYSLNEAKMTEDIIREKLEFLKPIQFHLKNESELHRGHRGNNGGEHFNLYIVSELFENKNIMERHRLIYEALEGLIPGTIHALSLKTISPKEL